MMKKTLIILLSLLGSVHVAAQVITTQYENSSPMPKMQKAMVKTVTHNLPAPDLTDIVQDTVLVPRFGKAYDSTFSLDDGVWVENDSGRVWTTSFVAENAKSLNLVFDDVVLPEGAELYVSNEDNTIVFGPVNQENIGSRRTILSDVIPGSRINVALFEPAECLGSSRLTISKVVYGFMKVNSGKVGVDLPFDGDVVVHPELEFYADGMGYVLFASGEHYCSGALVMTTDKAYHPYFLTTYMSKYSGFNMSEHIDEVENGMFKFHTRRKTPNGNSKTTGYSYYGSTVKAQNSFLDFLLVEINAELKNNKNLTWLGWDRSGRIPPSGFFLYHTSKGLEQIHLVNEPFQVSRDMILYPNDTVWKWTVPTHYGFLSKPYTYGGPLLDDNYRLVGQTHVYIVTLQGTVNLGCSQIREFTRWQYPNAGDDLLNWLDPTGSNVMTIDASKPLLISGETIPCGLETYEIEGLPEGYQVEWRLGSRPELIGTDGLGVNQCVIDNTNKTYINDTLKAVISKNGLTVQVLEKEIKTGHNLEGFASGMETLDSQGNITHSLIDGKTYTVTRYPVVLYSDFLNGAEIYFCESSEGVNLSNYYVIDKPSSSSGVMTRIKGVKQNSCDCFEIEINFPPLWHMMVTQQGESYSVSIVQPSETNSQETIDDTWSLSIINGTTGTIEFQGNVQGPVTVESKDWEHGVHIFKGEYGSETATQKVYH